MGSFSPPKPYKRSPDEIVSDNSSTRDALLRQVALAIASLQDAMDLEDSHSCRSGIAPKMENVSSRGESN
jgi:hypothetical protein